jgi:RsiW-degrading membrane proteinase PrsW (M82 family)
MTENRYQRMWMAVAVIAIVVALALMLVPQAHSGNSSAWLAILPVLFIGVVAPLLLLAFLERLDPRSSSAAPDFEPFCQRPPPFWRG